MVKYYSVFISVFWFLIYDNESFIFFPKFGRLSPNQRMNPTLLVITGAGSGIGLNLSVIFIQKKTPVILVDSNEQSLFSHFQENENTRILVGNVAEESLWEQVIELAKRLHLPISHLINCAGVIQPGYVKDFKLTDIDFHLSVNAKGSILGTTVIGKEMIHQEFGHIINVSSLAGMAPVAGMSLYSASKFAIRGFSLAANAELRDYGVDVSVICPDLVATPMLDLQLKFPEESALAFSGPKKILQPADVSQAILKLMQNPKPLVCLPTHRGILAKIAGTWPWIAEIFRSRLVRRGLKNIERLK